MRLKALAEIYTMQSFTHAECQGTLEVKPENLELVAEDAEEREDEEEFDDSKEFIVAESGRLKAERSCVR